MVNISTFAKNSVRPRKNTAEGGCGGNSAVFLQKIEASPAACIVRGRSQQKSFLFLLEEKIGRAQKKSRENFFAGWRALASGGGAASFVGGLPEMRSDFVQGMEHMKIPNNIKLFGIFISPVEFERKRGRENGSFPVVEALKPQGVRERTRASLPTGRQAIAPPGEPKGRRQELTDLFKFTPLSVG